MNKKTLIKAAPVVAFALVAGACDEGWTDLTGLNDNPNAPTDVSAEFLFTEGLQESLNDLLGISLNLDYASHLAQHTAEIAYAEEDIYVYRGNEVEGLFGEAFAEYGMDFQQTILKAREAGKPNVEAAGLVMKTWTFQHLTDIWGDLPYSQAFQGNAEEEPVISPAYDPQQQIYTQMLSDLTTAATLIDPAISNAQFAAQDLIYGGDMGLWQKFANSLHLRVAMRLSEVDPATAQAEITAALNAPGGVFESIADNPAICYNAVSRNPWFSYYEGRPGDFRVSATLIDSLKSFNDPRIAFYAQPAETTGEYVGMPNGRLDGHGFQLAGTSWPGDPFMAMDACFPLMTYSEVLFILAEAAARGWYSGDAATLYNQAITASMQRWGIPQAEIDAYLAQPRVQFNPATWREQIGLQKWLSLFGQGLEAYAEVRRLNYPVLTPGPGATIDQLPARYPYPLDEELLNGENFAAALSNQSMSGALDQTAPVWWDAN